MLTSGVYVLLVTAALTGVFFALQAAVGMQSAFLALCWLPMAGLLTAIGLHHHLGYSVLALLAATLAASICLAIIGGRLCANARRERTAIAAFASGTVLAGLPLALIAAWVAIAALP